MENNRVLEFESVTVSYGNVLALDEVSLYVDQGEIVCLLGGNASGKTTTMKTMLGVVAPKKGRVTIKGEETAGISTAEIIHRGVAMVPENRELFSRLSVLENIRMGAFLRSDKDEIENDYEYILELFPRMKERLKQRAGTLSGGEQQMVAVARALMARPDIILMDEPSMGLAPALVKQSFELIERIHAEGKTVFVVEQNANASLAIANRGYVLQSGRMVLSGDAQDLLSDKRLQRAYLSYAKD